MQIARNQNLSYRPVIATISTENILQSARAVRPGCAPPAQSNILCSSTQTMDYNYKTFWRVCFKIQHSLLYRLLSKYQTKPNLSCSNPLGQCKERKRLAFTASSKCNGQSFEPRQVRSERSLDIDNWSWEIIAAETRTYPHWTIISRLLFEARIIRDREREMEQDWVRDNGDIDAG